MLNFLNSFVFDTASMHWPENYVTFCSNLTAPRPHLFLLQNMDLCDILRRKKESTQDQDSHWIVFVFCPLDK